MVAKKIDIDTFIENFCFLENGERMRLQPWQRRVLTDIFEAKDERGLRNYNLALIMVCKKSGKSTLAGAVAGYGLLVDEPYDAEVYSVSGSRDQARLVFQQAVKFFKRSPLLFKEVKIYKDAIAKVDDTGVYRVLSSDAPRLHGLNPSLVIFDEIWNQGSDYTMYEALTTVPTRKEPLTFCISYAGFNPVKGDLLFDLYTAGKECSDPGMYFFYSNDPYISDWITPEYVEQQRRRLPEFMFRRMHLNEWVSGAGRFLSEEMIRRAVDPDLSPRWTGSGYTYFVSLDVGLKRDRTAVAVMHKGKDTGNIILDNLRIWEGSPSMPVSLAEVQGHIEEMIGNFQRVSKIIVDPYQASYLMENLKARGLPVEEFPFTPRNISFITMNLLFLFKEGRLKIYEHEELLRELTTVHIREMPYGVRLDNSESGTHDDAVIALAMGALFCVQDTKRVIDWDGDVEKATLITQAEMLRIGEGSFWEDY